MANVRVYGATPQTKSSEGSPVLAGILVACVLIVGWVVLAGMTKNDAGFASWGVGALLGLVIAKTARPPSKSTGILAAVMTLVTVLVAKVALVSFALQPALRQEFVQNPQATSALYMLDMAKNHSFSPELQRTIDTRPELLRDTSFMGQGRELRFQMISEASARAKTATAAERERLVRTHIDNTILEKLGFWVLLLTTFGPLDLLWMGLGISTAWKLGTGTGF